jgi:hypothetical protein
MHTWFGLVVPRATIGLKTYDGHFRKQRRLWNVALSPKFLNEVAAQCFVGAANDLADVWMEKAELAGAGRAFEAQNDVKMATLDGMWMMCGGTSLGLMAARKKALQDFGAVEKKTDIKVSFAKVEMPEFYDILQTLLVCLDWVMQGFSPRVYTFIFRYTGFLGRAEREKDKILDACIALSRARVEKGVTGMTCALDEVIRKDLRLNDGSKTDIVDNPALRDELLELLITGHETTASSISWALKYLTDNPQAQTRLRESLQAAFVDKQPSTQEHITTSLPYLDAVIAETLRVSSVGPVSFRQTLVPCEIMGHCIPANTPIILVTAGPSYNSPDIPSAKLPKSLPHLHALNIFAPERWLVDGKFDPEAVHMLPFSAGPRGCFGKQIALLEMRIMIAALVLRFEFPRLAKTLSGYDARDGLTRRPASFYVHSRAIKRSGD